MLMTEGQHHPDGENLRRTLRLRALVETVSKSGGLNECVAYRRPA